MLFLKNKIFQRGQTVYTEERQMLSFTSLSSSGITGLRMVFRIEYNGAYEEYGNHRVYTVIRTEEEIAGSGE